MGDYPREIELDDRTKDRLRSYIEDELNRHYAERGDYLNNLEAWQVDYWAEPSTAPITFPYNGASSIIVPLAAITVEAIHSRVMTTMFALSQFTSAKPASPKWVDYARPVERFLDNELIKNIGIHTPVNNSVLEVLKYGSGVCKTGFEKIQKTAVREVGGVEKEVNVVIKNNATVESVPVSRFLMPHVYQNPHEASWCGEEHVFTPYEVRLMENSGKFKPGTMEKLKAHFTTSPANNAHTGQEFQENQASLEGRETHWPERILCHELWMAFDVEGNEDLVTDGLIPREAINNGYDKEIVVIYHRDSSTFMSIRYNWHEDLRRPYETGVYFPVEHRWPGIGICKQVDQFQREITTQHRQRIDNATIANCRMLKVSNLTKYGPDEPIFPGKMWFVDNMSDIETFQLGEVYPSSFSNENQALLYVQQRTGVNELNQGMPQMGTPGTATGDLARIQEGNKKHDYTYSNIKNFVNRVVKGTVLNIKQFGPRASVYYELVEDGDKVKEFFAQDFEQIKQGMLLDITVAGQQDNKLLDRNNWQAVSQLLTSYYENILQLAQASQNQALIQVIVQNGLTAATETMKQILESYDLKNVDRIVVQELLHNGQFGAAQPSAGAIAGPPQPSGQPGMGGFVNNTPQIAAAKPIQPAPIR